MKYALLSVSDKTGLLDFARTLVAKGFTLLSTGGTFKALGEAKIPVTEVSSHTGFPEMMDGRVKTLHPKIHGGLLQLRDHAEHRSQADAHGIPPIDLVVVNLYPFEKTVAKPDCALEEAIENIDIGGPAMLRSAAKNYRFVTVICDVADYARVAAEIQTSGETGLATRQELALKVYATTSSYDASIRAWLGNRLGGPTEPVGGRVLRYGENPHQKAWLVPSVIGKGVPQGRLLHGKEMSYNNYLDADAALETALEYRDVPAAVVVKHGNPCGIATGKDVASALRMAWEGDVVSAFGSVIALTRPLDLAGAEFLKGKFVEVILAPSYDEDALAFLKAKSKDLRLVDLGGLPEGSPAATISRPVRGGVLVQTPDDRVFEDVKSVTKKPLAGADLELAKFAYAACKHVKSNAIILAGGHDAGGFMLLGMGAGQPNRVDSLRKLAKTKAEENIRRLWGEGEIASRLAGALLASDAFFPFPDAVEEAAQAGVRKIVQPGGSLRDGEVIAAADRLEVSMAFTGLRHFLH